MKEGHITMSTKELDKLTIIRQVHDKKIKQKEASERLGLCVRQIKRILAEFRLNGASGLIHKSRGKPSHKAKKPAEKHKIMALWQGKYQGFGPTLFSEKLEEREGVKICDETLRKWYPQDLPTPDWQRKKRPHRKWRERKPHFGEMSQTDGSDHDWFEGRGAKCNLQGMVDDATGEVFAYFCEYEGTLPMMSCLKNYSLQYGLPHSFYFDMHTTYKSPKRLSKEDQIAGEEPLSQFGRALEELGIQRIYARSPQAKGRVERLFKTFQDRLVKEMRLEGISSIEEANQFLKDYLPKYNKRFKKQAAESNDWHKRHLTPKQITHALCIKRTRVVQKDSTISYLAKRFLILDPICRTKITVETHLDGKLILRGPTGKTLKYKPIPLELYEREKQAEKDHIQKQKNTQKKQPPKSTKPSPNHPWNNENHRITLKELNKKYSKKRGHFYVGN